MLGGRDLGVGFVGGRLSVPHHRRHTKLPDTVDEPADDVDFFVEVFHTGRRDRHRLAGFCRSHKPEMQLRAGLLLSMIVKSGTMVLSLGSVHDFLVTLSPPKFLFKKLALECDPKS